MYNGKALRKADPSTIQDKLLVGYQGWFTCPGDGDPVGRGHHGWLHWFNYPVPDGGRPNTDIWPDVSEYNSSELFEAPGLKTQGGEKCHVFSSRNKDTVNRHFNWMAQHGVHGAFLQRFAGQCDGRAENDGIRRIRDEIGERVQEAAETNGRVYAIMYDVSGVPPGKIEDIIKHDFKHLAYNKRVFDSPSYLREKGKPVVALWGFGFEDSRHTPGLVRSIASYINRSHPGGVYLMAGVPAHWRTSTGDADRNPGFVDVWLDCFDAISPWTIGRYGNTADADKFAEEKIAGDVKFISERNNANRSGKKVDYIPVVFPGGSGHNLSEGKWNLNDIPRDGGRFLWRQVYNARKQGVRTIYGAMWDEYDEGTALMPIVTHKNQLPQPVRDQYKFLAPDADKYDLPSDWYMRICGLVVEILRGDRRLLETFPHKELQDYWGTRPRYEDGSSGGYVHANASTPGTSGSGLAQTLAEEENPDEPPPPPYTLEAGSEPAKSPSPTQDGFSTAPTSPGDQQNYDVSDLANDFGRHTLGGPSPQSPTHPPVHGGPNSRPTSPPHVSALQTTAPTVPGFGSRPTSPPESAHPQPSSYFSPPVGPSQGIAMPSMPAPHDMKGPDPDHMSVNYNTPFHWDDHYHNPQNRPLIHQPSKPTPPQSTYPGSSTPGQGHSPVHSTYPGQGHPQQSSYPGQAHSGPPSPNVLPQHYGQHQSSHPGMANSPPPGADHPHPPHPLRTQSGPIPMSNSPPLVHGPGSSHRQSSYPVMMNASSPPDRPMSSSPPLPQGFGQHQSPYPVTTGPPPPAPARPPTSHASKPGTPHHHSSLPPQTHPQPLPGGYNFSPGPTQPAYGGINPSASPPPNFPHQPGPYGYQQPPQQQSPYPGYNTYPPGSSPYPGYPGSQQGPPLPPRPDWPPSGPSTGGPSGPGFNQNPHQNPYSPSQQQPPPQGYGGPTPGSSYSASMASSYSNATGAWKKQQTGVLGLAKDTVDKLTGKDTRKNMQASVHSVLKPFMK